jgi:hypothetical protein
MSVQKNHEDEQRTAKRKAETIEVEKKETSNDTWWCKEEKSVDGRARDSKPP